MNIFVASERSGNNSMRKNFDPKNGSGQDQHLALVILCLLTFLEFPKEIVEDALFHRRACSPHRGTSLRRSTPLLGPYSRTIPRVLRWSQGEGWFLMSEVPLCPLSSEYCTCKTGNARVWPWLSGSSPYNLWRCPLVAWHRHAQ